MKYILTIVTFLLALTVKGQHNYNNGKTCDFILVDSDTSLITAFNGLDRKDFGIYLGVRYQGLSSGSIFYTPFNSINRLGISKGFLDDGIRVSAGVKITPNGSAYTMYPEVGVQLHPVRLISRDRNSFDIVLSTNISNVVRYGFGISFPLQYRNNFRL
jgi:hypothetical protein